jgi:hypothetical protein
VRYCPASIGVPVPPHSKTVILSISPQQGQFDKATVIAEQENDDDKPYDFDVVVSEDTGNILQVIEVSKGFRAVHYFAFLIKKGTNTAWAFQPPSINTMERPVTVKSVDLL